MKEERKKEKEKENRVKPYYLKFQYLSCSWLKTWALSNPRRTSIVKCRAVVKPGASYTASVSIVRETGTGILANVTLEVFLCAVHGVPEGFSKQSPRIGTL